MEGLQKQLEEVERCRGQLERELSSARADLETAQREHRYLPASHPHRSRLLDTIQSLESRVRELVKKLELQDVLHEELSLEMTALKKIKSPGARRDAWGARRSSSADVTTEPFPYHRPQQDSPPRLATGTLAASSPSLLTVAENRVKLPPQEPEPKKGIDKILELIEHDNRLLAELDQPTPFQSSAVSKFAPIVQEPVAKFSANSVETGSILNLKASISFPTSEPIADQPSSLKTTVTLEHLDKLMAKLEHDNRILAELDKKRSHLTTAPTTVPVTSHSVIPQSKVSSYHPAAIPAVYFSANSVPAAPPQPVAEDTEESADYIDLPGRGRCRVCIARYTYDPLKQSPNENPETELYLNAGEYILISGDIDEDGFYMGELLDGRKGLVPSNFIEKLTGEDLYDFQATVIYGGTRDSDESSASFSYAQDMDLAQEESHPTLAPDDYHRMNDYIELEDLEDTMQDPVEVEKSCNKPIPHPQRLILERQLNKSVLIGWLPPSVNLGTPIDAYHVYVDGVLKSAVRAAERTRALLEGVDSSQPHRVSVRSVSANGAYSKDAACTIVIGKDVPLAPGYVRASAVTAHSAIVSWLPCNSNFQHAVAVNSVEVKVVRAGVFRHLVAGLSANTVYRVAVRTRPGRLLYNDEKSPRKLELLTAYVDFRTFPKALPDPPVNIQVEAGPQDGTVLVTWLPVRPIAATDAPVSGYAVFSGPRRVAEVESPTGDHVLIDVRRLQDRRPLTVRTRSGDSMSSESLPAPIPEKLLQGVPLVQPTKKMAAVAATTTAGTGQWPLQPTVAQYPPMEAIGHRTRLNHHPKIPKDGEPNYSEDEYELQQQQQQQAQMRHAKHNQAYYQNQQTYYNNMQQAKPYPQNHQQPPVSTTAHSYNHNHAQNQQGYQYNVPQPPPHLPQQHYKSQNYYNMMQQPQGPSSTTHQPTSQPVPYYNNSQQGAGPSPTPGKPLYNNAQQGYYGPPKSTHQYSNNDQAVYNNQQQSSYCRDHQRGDHDKRGGPLARGQRWFVALFDYDPKTMSPNPDAADEELPFHEGELIKILGDKDVDGFYRGECNGRAGLVPCNMVSEVHLDQNNAGPHVHKMVAMYDYDPRELSPNVDSEMELAFKTGDVIYVYGQMDEDGFYVGEVNGRRGLVPSNFLTSAANYKEGGEVPSPPRHIYENERRVPPPH